MTRSPSPDPRSPSRVLIIRPSALGDVARTVPCLVMLRRSCPAARIDWLVDRRFADAVRSHPALDGVVEFDRAGGAIKGAGLLRQLRRAQYDWVIDLQGLARSGLFTWATRARVRLGYANAREMGWLGYTMKARVDESQHAIDRMIQLVTTLDVPRVPDMSLALAAEDMTWFDTWSATQMLEPGRYICVAPTAQWGCKCWPLNRYIQVTRRLLDEPGVDRVVVLAAPSERAGVEAGLAALGTPQRERTVMPTTRVGQLMALIRHARLLICNDSAPLHLAVGLGVPTLSLFGPTDPRLVGPPTPNFFDPPPGQAPALPLPPTPDAQRVAALIRHGRHRVLQAPSAIGQTLNYRDQKDDDTLISELSTETVWAAVREAMASGSG